MWHFGDIDLEFVVQSGFLYVPLMFDPGIEKELRASHTHGRRQGKDLFPKRRTIVELNGKCYIIALNLHSLVENFESIYKDSFEEVRKSYLEKHCPTSPSNSMVIDEKLRTILFEILPHFVRRSKLMRRKTPAEGDILDWLSEKLEIPQKCYPGEECFINGKALQKTIDALEKRDTRVELPEDGLISSSKLRQWLIEALEARIGTNECERLKLVLREHQQWSKGQKRHVTILSYLKEKGSLEIDDFGFSRIPMTNEYFIYKHTGQYALKDYYGRIYLFPDCKVGVSSVGSLRPVVLDVYKHPFLEGHYAGQYICTSHLNQAKEFNARNVIDALEEGINALFYGYNSRRRNGYHSLDRTTLHPMTIDFYDYYVPKDHPKIISGQVEIKNDFK